MLNLENVEFVETVSAEGITWAKIVGCEICERADENGKMPFIGHFNCLYQGKAIGHTSSGHCTADSCY